MSVIEANIIIDVPDSVDVSRVISELQNIISNINNKQTSINVVQIDDPLSMSKSIASKWE